MTSALHVGPMTFKLLHADVLRVEIGEGAFLKAEDIVDVELFMETNFPGQKFYNLFVFGDHADMDHIVKAWATDPQGNTRTKADAIVVSNQSQQIQFEFYLENYEPVVATQIFNTEEEALHWIESLRSAQT